MRGTIAAGVVASALTMACGGGHGGGGAPPSTVPIAPVTVDALYVVNGGDASISVIDAATSTVIGTIDITDAEFPHHLYLTANREEMYLAVPGVDLSAGHGGGHGGHVGGGHVLRLDATTGETLAVASLESTNHNAAPATDGTVWTTQMTEPGSVLVLDGMTLATVRTIEVGSMPAEVTFSSDGTVALVANGISDTVSAISLTTHEVLETITVGDNPVGAWPATDGFAYVDNEGGQSISVIALASLAVTATFDLGFTPAFAAVVQGELWVTDVDGGRVVFLDKTTGGVVGEVATGAGAHAIAVKPDEATVWITNQGADTVSVIDTASRAVTATIPVGAAPNGLAFRALP